MSLAPTQAANDQGASSGTDVADSAFVLAKFDEIVGGKPERTCTIADGDDGNTGVGGEPHKAGDGRIETFGHIMDEGIGGANDDEVNDGELITEWAPELTRLVQFKDLRGNTQVIHASDFTRRKRRRKKRVDHQWRGHALILRKVLDINFGLLDHRLELRSPGLCAIFKQIARPFQELDLETRPIIIPRPFRCLFYLREQLEECTKSNYISESDKKQIQELLEFIATEPVLQKVVTAYNDLIPRKKITLAFQWALFRPHELIYMRGAPGPSRIATEMVGYLTKIERHTHWHPVGGSQTSYTLHYVIGYHSGRSFSLTSCKFQLSSTSQEPVEINSQNLWVLPLRFLPPDEQTKIRDRLVARGKRYIELCQSRYSLLHYNGSYTVSGADYAKMLGPILGGTGSGQPEWSTSQRVVIDRQAQREQFGFEPLEKFIVAPCLKEYISYLLGEPRTDQNEKSDVHVDGDDADDISLDSSDAENNSYDDESDSDSSEANPKKSKRKKRKRGMVWSDQTLSNNDYLLCPPTITGFLLHNKIWSLGLSVSGLKEIAWKDDPYLALQLPEEKKALVKNLVHGFGTATGSQRSDFEDVIVGKGRGIVFLLHGPPGLGKTLTAESIAESAHRPLYHVSTGELSVDVSRLEKQLTDIFRLGLRWGAVVLIDEADVLMARRSTTELTRNAIVAVFLRLLEYYHGMLFLTTNRMEDFDDAFYNRIHVSIRYEPLQMPERKTIWRQHLTRACKQNKNAGLWPDEAYDLLAKVEMNGRDIRNFTRTAFGYAQALGKDIEIGHVVLVVRNNLSLKSSPGLENFLGRLEEIGREVKSAMSSSNAVEDNTSPGGMTA